MKRMTCLTLAFLALFTFIIGCDGDGGGNPGRSNLDIRFSPNPVNRAVDGKWHYKVTIEETSGIGVTIDGMDVQTYRDDGQFHYGGNYSVDEFCDWFDDCGGSGSYIPAGSIRCGYVWSGKSDVPPDYRYWTFTGIDDFDNRISATARVTLQ